MTERVGPGAVGSELRGSGVYSLQPNIKIASIKETHSSLEKIDHQTSGDPGNWSDIEPKPDTGQSISIATEKSQGY
ncbi:uncharacterized protein N7529_008148 [Penicillium soppii]|uniref:uncharacterized protein n=1 Tax=Penicillium soppii TaxID=69789 RepID=UPI002549A24E|nr:uncharacterized protein N7529_008148 [Penicillium soppii]KAJ5860838.1 hypothetical protein N7529_008148 [Penicillium soppii]